MTRRGKPSRSLLGGVVLLATSVFVASACSSGGPQTSGTKTNWFSTCDENAECEGEGSCLCGMCTVTCLSTSDCEQGSCASEIASAASCEGKIGELASAAQICVAPTSEECAEAALPTGTTLGAAAPVDCDAAGALICEDFEGLLPDVFTTWSPDDATVGLQECQSHIGQGALRFSTIDDAWTQTRMRLPTPLSTGALHVRFFLRVEEGGKFPEQLILFELWDQEEGEVDDRTTLYLTGDEGLEVFLGPGPHTARAQSLTPVTRDEWHCVELGLELSDTGGTVSVSLDGMPVIEESGVDTRPSEDLIVAVLEGFPKSDSVGTEVSWFVDDLVVATEAIGCD